MKKTYIIVVVVAIFIIILVSIYSKAQSKTYLIEARYNEKKVKIIDEEQIIYYMEKESCSASTLLNRIASTEDMKEYKKNGLYIALEYPEFKEIDIKNYGEVNANKIFLIDGSDKFVIISIIDEDSRELNIVFSLQKKDLDTKVYKYIENLN